MHRVSLILLCLGFLALAPAYWIALHAPAVGLYHDDGVYLTTAKALAMGQGYRIISLPAEIQQTKYPILFPLALAAIWKVDPEFPSNVFLLKLVPFLACVAWLILSYRLLCALGLDRLRALAVVLLTASSPGILHLATTLLSETLFAALCTGSLLLLQRGRKPALAGALAGLAVLTRTAGSPLIAAGVLILLFRKRWNAAAQFTAAALVLYLPWVFWVATHSGVSADPYYSAANYKGWNVLLNFPWPAKMAIFGGNALMILGAPLAALALPGQIAIVAGILILLGFIRDARRRPAAVHVFIAAYLGLLLLWAWPPARFVTVLLPLMLYFLAVLFAHRRVVLTGVFLLLAVWAAPALYRTAAATRDTGIVAFYWPHRETWSETARLMEWTRANTPQDAVLLSNLDPMIYLFTGRKAIRGFSANPYLLFYAGGAAINPIGSLDSFHQTILQQKVRYIVITPGEGFGEQPHLNRLVDGLQTLQLVYEGATPQYRVYAVKPS